MKHMPAPGTLYRRKGGGFITLHVSLNDEIHARILADRFDVGYVSGPMSVADFWSLVDAGL